MIYRILGSLIIITGILSGAFYYGVKYQNMKSSIDKQNQIIASQQNEIVRLNKSIIISNKVDADYVLAVESQRESYIQFTRKLQDENNKAVANLNKSNHTNQLLWQFIRSSLNTKQLPVPPTTSESNADTARVEPSRIIGELAYVGQVCRQQRTQLIFLQNWIIQQQNLYGE